MNPRWITALLLVVGLGGHAAAEGENFVGFAIQPTTLIGLAYERTWGDTSLGFTFGGATWGQDAESTYLNPGVTAAYRWNQWSLSPEMSLELRTFVAASLYYYSGAGSQPSNVVTALAGDVGFDVRYVVKKFLVVGLSLGQAVAGTLSASPTTGVVSMPLPGLTVGFCF